MQEQISSQSPYKDGEKGSILSVYAFLAWAFFIAKISQVCFAGRKEIY